MLPKPESCRVCPFYSDGLGFVPDELIPGATTMVLGQNPGSTEEHQGRPFVGSTGQTQTEHFFPLARLERGKNVHIANLLKCRWTEHGKKTDKLPTGAILEQAIEHCTTTHLRIPEGTQVIIAEGAPAASWCAGRPIKIYQWRGHVLHPVRKELDGTNDRRETRVLSTISNQSETGQSKEGCCTTTPILYEWKEKTQQNRVLEQVSTNGEESKTVWIRMESSGDDVQRTRKSLCSLQSGTDSSDRPQPYDNESTRSPLQSVQSSSRMVGGVDPNTRSSGPIYQGRGLQVYVIEHLASVLRDPRSYWISICDWRKVPRLTQGWPQPIPTRLIATQDNWPQVLEWFTTAIRRAPYVAIDTEYIGRPFGPTPPMLTIIGLGYQDQHGHIHGLQIDCRIAENWMRASFYRQLAELVELCPVVFQNYAADMPVLKRCAGIQYHTYKQVNDTMLRHAVLYCELAHDLEFLTSIYGLYPKMKHLGGDQDTTQWDTIRWLLDQGRLVGTHGETPDLLYNWGDVIETLNIEAHLIKAFEMDTQAQGVYLNQSVKLIPILLKSMERGLRVNKPRVMRAKVEYETRCQEAQALAEAYLGRPINLGSDEQLKYYAYQEQGYPIQYHTESKRPTVDENAVATLRDYVGPAVDPRVTLTLEVALQRIEQGADPVLEGRVLYQEAQHAMDCYIYGLVKTVYHEQQETRKKKARELVKKHGFTIDDVVDRVYPNFAIHTQKTGRWSTTNPPLAQLPGDLRDIIIPDEGEVWLHWDWKGIELHFLEVHSGSRILKQAHEDGIDLHTWTLCKMFGYEMPPNLCDPYGDPVNETWRTKYSLHSSGDPRRVFAKGARYECVYGGTGNNAAEKAIRMGLSKTEVKKALDNLMTADVDYYRWRQQMERTVKSTRLVRTFMGRPRRFLTVSKDHSTVVPAKVVREALDYPMQGGVSDVANTTIVRIAEQYPWMTFAWMMHDSQYWAAPVSQVTDEVVQGVKDIATAEYVIEGRRKRFPIDFDVITHNEEHT